MVVGSTESGNGNLVRFFPQLQHRSMMNRKLDMPNIHDRTLKFFLTYPLALLKSSFFVTARSRQERRTRKWTVTAEYV
jgi:hypothetical protein